MKKQKIKKMFYKRYSFFFAIFFVLGVLFGFVVGIAFGAGTIKFSISPQLASNNGSNNSIISFTGAPNEGYYVNDGDNSAIIGDYFEGYYYDSVFGLFRLDWSSDSTKNVRIIGSTSKCSTGYGYKLGGKAYNTNGGYVDFNYDDNIFVYYCLDDKKLHGIAYNKYIGYQDFEGINFDITPNINSIVEEINSDIFVNDTSSITQINSSNGGNSNASTSTTDIGGDKLNLDDTKESIFYIIK